MLLAIKSKLLIAFAAPLVLSAFTWSPGPKSSSDIAAPALIELQARVFQHRNAGDFSQDGRPVNAPLRAIRPERPLAIMTHQVTAADYQRCVDDHACPRASDPIARPDLPVVNVSAR